MKKFGCYFIDMVPRQAINAIENILQICESQKLAVLRFLEKKHMLARGHKNDKM